MEIHPTAIVSPHAELADRVKIGPYSIIGEHVRIGRDTVVESHAVIDAHTTVGERNHIYPFVSIGLPPQDTGYKQEDTRVIIGDNNIIRECSTIHRATTKQDLVTVLGNDNYLMAYSHVAHDCLLGNHIILSNMVNLGGHTSIGDYASLGGLTAVHQFVKIGAYAFIGGMSGISQDIPPFMIAAGSRARLYGPNQKGLKRQGFSDETIRGLKKVYRIIWRETRILSEGIKRIEREVEPFPELNMLLDFIRNSERGVLR
jgi:UDP-N-acetylglucosamine acyltransferase